MNPSIGEWNRKRKKSKTICSRVDVYKIQTKMYLICFWQVGIIIVYQIITLDYQFGRSIIEKLESKFVRMP